MSVGNKYRMFRRGTVYYIHDNQTGKQESLRTEDRIAAERLLHARNEAQRQPTINLQIARAYLMVADPKASTRTWQEVMDELLKLKKRKADSTSRRWDVAVKDKALDVLRSVPLLETRAEHLLRAMEKGKISTNIYLRRIHNFAIGMNWLPVPIISNASGRNSISGKSAQLRWMNINKSSPERLTRNVALFTSSLGTLGHRSLTLQT